MTLTPRRIAGLLEAPGCERRMRLDLAGIDLDAAARALGIPAAGRSGFAIERHRRFLARLAADDHAELLASAGPLTGARVVRRVQLAGDRGATEAYVLRLLTHPDGALHYLVEPVVGFAAGSHAVLLAPDELVLAAGPDALRIVEIRDYPLHNGQADPYRVQLTARELAVSVIALRQLAQVNGIDRVRVDARGVIVLPVDFGLRPGAAALDVRPQVARLLGIGRALARLADTPIELTEAGICALPARFGDGCANCPLFVHCAGEQRADGLVARAGSALANVCGTARTVAEARMQPEFARAAVAARLAGLDADVLAGPIEARS